MTCEELVSDEYIRRDPTLTRIFGECVSAVVHCLRRLAIPVLQLLRQRLPALKGYDKASNCQDAEDAKGQLAKAAAKAGSPPPKPGDAKLAEAAVKAKKAAEDAAARRGYP